MKSSLNIGDQATVTIEVTEAMCPAFDGVVVHRVCSTWDMAHHMEVAARRVLAPHLGDDEEGIGSHIDIDHVSPAPVGTAMLVRAEAVELDASTLVCTIEARQGDTVFATGRQIQRIFSSATIADIMQQAIARTQSSHGATDS
jgi:fluoroacetyl-CoA thioesterase